MLSKVIVSHIDKGKCMDVILQWRTQSYREITLYSIIIGLMYLINTVNRVANQH